MFSHNRSLKEYFAIDLKIGNKLKKKNQMKKLLFSDKPQLNI